VCGNFGFCTGATNPALDHWNHIVELNTLTAEGKIPFYLKVEFQLFDLQGKPGETGTAEIWWSPQGSYEVIASPSWNWTSAPGESHQPKTRQSYLIDVLLQQIMQPLHSAKPSPAFKVVEADRTFGSTVLRCLSMNPPGLAVSLNTICVDPATDGLRMNTDASAHIVRDKMGKFKNTEVPLDLTATYLDKKAITGKVVALNSISADDEHIKPLPASADTPKLPSSPGVVAGRKIGGMNPAYPETARTARVTGSVIIHATISKEGKLTSPIVIATASEAFDDAALEAVRTWKYQPYLLNGQPTDVDTHDSYQLQPLAHRPSNSVLLRSRGLLQPR